MIESFVEEVRKRVNQRTIDLQKIEPGCVCFWCEEDEKLYSTYAGCSADILIELLDCGYVISGPHELMGVIVDRVYHFLSDPHLRLRLVDHEGWKIDRLQSHTSLFFPVYFSSRGEPSGRPLRKQFEDHLKRCVDSYNLFVNSERKREEVFRKLYNAEKQVHRKFFPAERKEHALWLLEQRKDTQAERTQRLQNGE